MARKRDESGYERDDDEFAHSCGAVNGGKHQLDSSGGIGTCIALLGDIGIALYGPGGVELVEI